MLLDRVRIDVADVLICQGFEYRVVHDEVGVHLEEVLLVELNCGLLHIDCVTHAVVPFEELPERVAFSVVRVLHHQVGSLNRASNLLAASHDAAEGALTQSHYQTSYTVDTHEDGHVVAVVLDIALLALHLHLDAVLDVLVCIVDFALHGEKTFLLVSGRPEDYICSLINEGDQPLNQVVDEPVLVEVVGLLG